MRVQIFIGFVSIIFFLTSVSTHASTITSYGSDIDGGAADWRTASVTKAADIDGDNIYGTDGWAMWLGDGWNNFAIDSRVSDLPAYVDTFLEGSGNHSWSGASYQDIDDPTSNPLVKIDSGTITTDTLTVGSYHEFISFTVVADGSFNFGVMADNLDGAQYNSAAYKLASSSGSSYEIALDSTSGSNKTTDIYFFQVEDAVAGETFILSGKVGATGKATVAAVTWDTAAVPEPSTIVLLLGGVALLVCRRLEK